MEPGNRKAIIAALLANLGIAIAKFVAYVMTGAASMLAEAVHSCADTGNQALLLWGGTVAAREPSDIHPFGYGRERYFWAFIVSMILFALGALFALYEGISKLQQPHELNQPLIAVSILVLALLLETSSFVTAMRVGLREKGDSSWWRFVRHTRNPELPVVLLEDLGALVGLAIALFGVGLSTLTGDARYDAYGSITIGVLLGSIAALLAYEMKSLLIGESATPEDVETIRDAIESGNEVRCIIHMKTQHLGPEQLLVAAKVEFDSSLDFSALTEAIDRAEERVRERLDVNQVMIYLEPDVYEPS